MKRLTWLILIFFLALTLPSAYLIWHTFQGLEQAEMAELRFFADELFDRMENELTALVQREEARSIEEYNETYTPPGARDKAPQRSPLSRRPEEPYIVGYFQNNPDGTFQSPMAAEADDQKKDGPADRRQKLTAANQAFNQKKTQTPAAPAKQPPDVLPEQKQQQQSDFAGRYLDVTRSRKPKAHLGQIKTRVEEITVKQAPNVAVYDQKGADGWKQEAEKKEGRAEEARDEPPADEARPEPFAPDDRTLQVEVDPMQSVFIDPEHVYIFRRIVFNNQVFRQGLVIQVRSFLRHLADTHFSGQPMARFTSLTITAADHGKPASAFSAGAPAPRARVSLNRVFPRPFSFLRAELNCDRPPHSPGRSTLLALTGILAAVLLIGLITIYHSARVVVDLSERRAGFVSSVTHELKTPLTNIRMYIEMLEQGIAQDPEREQEYFRILGSETGRLARLINNVLEFSKLEKRQRRLVPVTGTFEEVIEEARGVMREKLRQEGFTLVVEMDEVPAFTYDREAMLQVLINLLDNSMKFGRDESQRRITIRVRAEKNRVLIKVSDTGPGIPPQALKRIFEDFYRVDDSLTRNTRGTGIGLALVKKFVSAMGGAVSAENNTGPGCTITISLPLKAKAAA